MILKKDWSQNKTIFGISSVSIGSFGVELVDPIYVMYPANKRGMPQFEFNGKSGAK